MPHIIIFGSPGAGKGTQAKLVAAKYNLIHLSSGEMLRRELENGEFGNKIKRYLKAGKLVPNKIIIAMIETHLAKELGHGNFIFDGYPRTIKQASSLDVFLKERNIQVDLVINLKLSARDALKRILLRGKTSGRADDNQKTTINRLEVYKKQTAPLLKYYKKQKKLINIDGRQEIKKVFNEIILAIKKQQLTTEN